MRLSRLLKRSALVALAVSLVALSLVAALPTTARAAVTNPAPSAKVSFTFDDGLNTAYSQAAPTLATYGLNGTSYIITGCVGMVTTPNTCPADTGQTYMTWDQITALQNTYGWEIGSHTVDHPQLATDGLTQAQVAAELTNAKAALNAHGFTANDFATPYGDYNNMVLAEIAKVYASHRGFFDVDNNVWPYNDMTLENMQVQAGVTVAAVKAKVDDAIANNRWLVLTFHGIKTNPSTKVDDYEYSTANLGEIAAYVKTKQDANLIKNVHVSDGLVTSDSNLFTNGGFDSGISGGWTTNTPASVVADSANNGAYPSPSKSVAITAAASGNVHLFSPKVSVTSGQTYMFKNFVNITSRTAGEFGYYVDEYNSSGNWISGKWIKGITKTTVESSNFTYTPSSTNVKKASLQIYATGGSGIKAYVDQFQMFSLSGTTTTPPPATVNLLPNSTFDNGIADGWTTDKPAAFTADSGNHGSTTDPAKSVKLTAGTANAHLFAPKVNVKSTSAYTINAYLNLTALTSNEIGFYIDEYDASGNWVSGQYAFAQRTAGTNNVSFDYSPTMASVAKASLQVILPANSGATGYLDTVTWMAPAGEAPTPPAPAPTNLMPNGTFDAGITAGWTTNDPTNIVADSGNHGSPNNPVNSVSLTGSSVVRHLFSPKVTVDSTKSYSVTSWLDLQQITSGEVGFYVDEYDASGNWISGQYKTGVGVVYKGDVSFTYTPSSSNVKQASLQIIVTANSGIKAYLDDVRFVQN
jgi:peptidoglycan/xylan/chitin deacetylase (PgdA/CDA1 family)